MTHSGSQDLRQCLARYEAEHPSDVLTIDDQLSPDQDLTAIVFALEAKGRRPLMICRNVDALGVPVVTNTFASPERIARFLGATKPAEMHSTFVSRASQPLEPRYLDDGPILANVTTGSDIDLRRVPALHHFSGDRAPYITTGVIVAQDPDTGRGNCSYHRSMVQTPTQLATSLHSRGDLWRMVARAGERGEVLPVAMVIGAHPLFLMAAASHQPPDVDEREVAGGLFEEPMELVRTPKHGIGVPASAEIVIEGFIDPQQVSDEGPFGEFTGYSTHRSTRNLLTAENVMMRDDTMLLTVIGGHSPDHLNLGRVPHECQLAIELKERLPVVTDLHYPPSGVAFHGYVSVNTRLPGQGRQAALTLLALDQYLKLVIVVDEDVDVRNEAEVMRAVSTKVQADRDVFTIAGLPGILLDPSSSDETTARMGIDATAKADFEGESVVLDERAIARAREVLAG